MLGPIIRAEVGDEIHVVFRNRIRFPAGIHSHGVLYNKSSEGSPYNDGTSGACVPVSILLTLRPCFHDTKVLVICVIDLAVCGSISETTIKAKLGTSGGPQLPNYDTARVPAETCLRCLFTNHVSQ